MKSAISLLIFMFSISAWCQVSGVGIYKEIIQVDKSKVPPQYRDFQPDQREASYKLYFVPNKSMYQRDLDERTALDDINSKFDKEYRWYQKPTESIVYQDFETRRLTDQRFYMSRKFVIRDSLPRLSWKITSEQQKIGKYICLIATAVVRDTVPVTAWFTPAIRTQAGPDTFGQLPGLIVKIDEDMGKRVLLLESLELRPLTPSEELGRPIRGREISQKEFDELVVEKQKEQKEWRGRR